MGVMAQGVSQRIALTRRASVRAFGYRARASRRAASVTFRASAAARGVSRSSTRVHMPSTIEGNGGSSATVVSRPRLAWTANTCAGIGIKASILAISSKAKTCDSQAM